MGSEHLHNLKKECVIYEENKMDITDGGQRVSGSGIGSGSGA